MVLINVFGFYLHVNRKILNSIFHQNKSSSAIEATLLLAAMRVTFMLMYLVLKVCFK